MNKRFWILFTATLVLFLGGGFFVGYYGLTRELQKIQTYEVHVLTEKGFLFPDSLKLALERELPLRFRIEVAEDPDSFLEKASGADVLWARKDWILKTELHLTDFKGPHRRIQDLLIKSLSADFFDPEETSSTVLPFLWTLPLLRLPPSMKIKQVSELRNNPGQVQWPFWGLQEFFAEIPLDAKSTTKASENWLLSPSSAQTPEVEERGPLWFPPTKIKPLVVCLAFVENERLPLSAKEELIESWMSPRILPRLAFETKMAVTLIQAEEMLTAWQRASSLRLIGLSHLERP